MPDNKNEESIVSRKNEDYEILNKEFILFKEQTYSIVENLLEQLETEIKKTEYSSKKLDKINIRLKETELEKSKLEEKLEISTRQLNALKESKLGKLTRSYWKFRKKLVKGAK